MEYYSAIKRNTFESVLTHFESVSKETHLSQRWMNLEPIIRHEVCKKEKDKFRILTHIYGI